MLKEIVHFLAYAPGTLALKMRLERVDAFDTLSARLDQAGMAEKRTRLVGDLQGRVLEIGCGTGRMFAHYPQNARVTALEPNLAFLDRAGKVAKLSPAAVSVQAASGESLPFQAGVFDAAVLTMVLCSVTAVEAVLAEVRRVLKKEGELRLIEHGRSENALAGLLMNMFNPLWRAVNQSGCNMNRNPVAALEASGFSIIEAQPFQIFCPGLPAFPMKLIRAVSA